MTPERIKMPKLPRNFYHRPTLHVAQDLLGKFVIRLWRGQKLAGQIVETEAYIGPKDKACHAARGKTERTKIMFEAGGRAYIYLVYGMYSCLNVVTENQDFPAAVLIRALEPTNGIAQMIRNRGLTKKIKPHHPSSKTKLNSLDNYSSKDLTPLTSGPGKLCQALRLDKKLNGADLTGNQLWIENRGGKIAPRQIKRAKRIGVDYAGPCKNYLWRFYIKTNPCISQK